MEIFLNVEGTDGKYQVSNTGKVQKLTKKGYRVINQSQVGKGYLRVIINVDGVRKCNYVHRLVANAFIPNPNELPQVNHIDGDRRNNCVENLVWCTAKENIRHSYLIGSSKIGEDRVNSSLTNDQVVEIKKRIRAGFENRDIAYILNISPRTIASIRCGNTYKNIGGDLEMKISKVRLSRKELEEIKDSLPKGTMNDAAKELGVTYHYIWQLLNNGLKAGWYNEKIINCLKSYTK